MNVLSLSPMSYFVCNETGPFHIEFIDGHRRKVYMLLCVSVVTRKLYIMPMKTQDLTSLVQALRMLLFHHGKFNLILDKHNTHITSENRPITIELDPEFHKNNKLPILFNLLNNKKKAC